MDREVFTDAAVAATANESFIFFKVDAEKGEGVEIAKKYGARGFPTFVFTDGEGKELERQVGASGKDEFLVLMKDVAAGNHLAGLRAKVEKNPGDGELRAKLGIKLAGLDDPGARVHLEKAVSLDPDGKGTSSTEVRWRLAILDAGFDAEDLDLAEAVKPIEAFATKHPDSRQALDAHRLILRIASQTGDEKREEASLEFLLEKAPDAELRNSLAWFLSTRGRDLERALKLVDGALEEEPANPAYIDTRAECLSRLGRHDEAVAEQERAVALLSIDANVDEGTRAEYRARLEEFKRKRDEAKE